MLFNLPQREPLIEGHDYPDLDPRLRPAEPDSPMILDGDMIDGDPALMMRCMVEEFLLMGIDVDEVKWMARQPNYQAMFAAYRQLGDERVNEIIDDAASCVGVGRYRTVESISQVQPVTLTIGGTAAQRSQP